MQQTTYVMIKPGFADHQNVIYEIKKRILQARLDIVKFGYVKYSVSDARKHYEEHLGKSFYPELENYITSGKAYGMIVCGDNAIAKIRLLVQRDKAKGLQKGDIRYDIPKMLHETPDTTKNVIHASDKEESAEKEIKIFNSLLKKYNKIENNN